MSPIVFNMPLKAPQKYCTRASLFWRNSTACHDLNNIEEKKLFISNKYIYQAMSTQFT